MRAIHDAVLNEIHGLRKTPQSILDIGCGNGSFTSVLAATFRCSKFTAVDTSIQRMFSRDNIVFTEGKVEQLPFVSESFDLVITTLSLHHWKEKSEGIREIYRVLKKEGRLIIGDPLLEDWMSNRILGSLMQRLDGGVFADKKRITEYLNTAGFENIDIKLIPNTMKSLYLITANK